MDSARLPMLPLRGHFDKRVYFGVLCTKGHRIHFQVPLTVPLQLPGVELQSRLLWTSWPPATCLLILLNHGSSSLCPCVGAVLTAAAAALTAAVALPCCGGGGALHRRCLIMVGGGGGSWTYNGAGQNSHWLLGSAGLLRAGLMFHCWEK